MHYTDTLKSDLVVTLIKSTGVVDGVGVTMALWLLSRCAGNRRR